MRGIYGEPVMNGISGGVGTVGFSIIANSRVLPTNVWEAHTDIYRQVYDL